MATASRRQRMTYSGDRLAALAFPIGGIGTGTVSLGGSGELRDFEFLGRPNKNTPAGFNFFALWARPRGGRPVVKLIETQPLPPYTAAQGFEYTRFAGLPRMDSFAFTGEYPMAHLRFRDREMPLRVEMEAFNPFLPLDPDDSGLPAAVFIVTLTNPGRRPVDATLALSATNLAGWDCSGPLTQRRHPSLGKNTAEFRRRGGVRGVFMSTLKYPARSPQFGSMALATPWRKVSVLAHWPRGGWWDPQHHWWDDFAGDGRFRNVLRSAPSTDGQTDVATLALRARVAPGAFARLPLVLAWHFPNLQAQLPAGGTATVRNHYATRFDDAFAAARYTLDNLARLESATRRFRRALYESTLPPEALDAAGSQMSVLRSNTCFRAADGALYAYEGCSPKRGCCPLNCTHVWNYEQTVAFLFPSLERTMRETDFLANVHRDGKMDFRTTLPLGRKHWKHRAAADGQMGAIVRLYREWRFSGDTAWLKRLWPNAKRALEFARSEWDADGDGVMEKLQHNTYDIEFLGANTMTGALYLAALHAAARMAEALGEPKAAAKYRSLAERGAAKLDRLLWNGEYFEQKYDARKAPKYQYGRGCLADQLLGQSLATIAGLGHVLPRAHVRKTLASIFRYNWKPSLRAHANVQRVYAMGDEAGLVLCTWPRGARPAFPFPYSDEVWTGFEYQVAAHMIGEGMLDEGLAIVSGARRRHDGRTRSPWNEPECGDHYARAMSSWALLPALSGFEWSAPERRIRFAPKVNARDFRAFFSTGSGWGTYSQKIAGRKTVAQIRVEFGTLALRTVEVGAGRVDVSAAGRDRVLASGRTLRVTLDPRSGAAYDVRGR